MKNDNIFTGVNFSTCFRMNMKGNEILTLALLTIDGHSVSANGTCEKKTTHLADHPIGRLVIGDK